MDRKKGQPEQIVETKPQATQKVTRGMQEFSASVASLRTEADRARGLFGFGRRIIVPPDEIHVVVGDGRHILTLSNERKIFGQTADRPSRYWLNQLTQVIKLKTVSFTVPIRGFGDGGVEALDKSKVSFRLWAHAVAKLNPDKADVAAQRVGLDTSGLINTITEVGTAELIAASATMDLQDIIANRQKLAVIAFPKVNNILSELGYDLALLTVTQLEGPAYQKLVEQAEARISKETSIATNLEQVAELQDSQSRERNESEILADTQKKLAEERLEAEREVETATLSQQESLAIRRHEVQIREVERARLAAEASYDTDAAKLQFERQIGEAEAEKQAKLVRLQAEREAELRALRQQKNALIALAEAEAEATRLAVEQAKQIERAQKRTQADAKRLHEEELAAATRAKEVALLEANQLGEAKKVDAEAEARALSMRVEAQSNAELVKAEAEATAAVRRAEAAKLRAEATRAEAAAPGLAEAEVEAARVSVADKQVAVNRSEGLATAEIALAVGKAEAERQQLLKEVEIEAQRKLVELYNQAPILVELEKIRMDLSHKEKIAQIQTEAYVRAFESIAPGIRVNIFGNGGQASKLFTDLMSFSHGLKFIGEEVPVVGRFLNSENGQDGPSLLERLTPFTPFIQEVVRGMKPRVFSSLRVSDLIDRLGPVVAGRDDLASALGNLKDDANFRVVGDFPVAPIAKLFGVDVGKPGDSDDLMPDVEKPVMTGEANLDGKPE